MVERLVGVAPLSIGERVGLPGPSLLQRSLGGGGEDRGGTLSGYVPHSRRSISFQHFFDIMRILAINGPIRDS